MQGHRSNSGSFGSFVGRDHNSAGDIPEVFCKEGEGETNERRTNTFRENGK